MEYLKRLYESNTNFKVYVDKFAHAYDLTSDDALNYSMVAAVSELYTLNVVK